ncbi:hypothetical protein JQ557_33765 [Bradyrhizobium sp. U87765 SZCCT0131]|uniref:hypothetical protein n=1 Tax=unclassified Bradyrhizobium TaxID=2631580 RepID=UPI001BADFF1E|nr:MULTISPECIES: hypothetical protein [unclassified Bradyrhizobium]MBR1223008.1 hypothetical protein [Bradyrhizobium sp. U87765 SZCCT0131]MBR1262744.1 hypothetical protein [Bradyrhizobium sp. U87765 SZCCT0134]MBR1308784.1 hypothetical protein [Bradyrhizobium sp. U87765 SZCCT0110]MBR1318526.1 hypothetical protein [Bradyrhizobium sp. U87765 SZCCT0109]MBR1352230.1 hypothetical protein [Bradyrhizobium sp. U87765 SZCCT0048]
MTGRTADIPDLQDYRARRATTRTQPGVQAQWPLFMAPVGFVVGYFWVWPACIMVPQYPSAS